MRRIKHPFLRWIVAVVIITCFAIFLQTLYHYQPKAHRPTGIYNIHFVNYQGRTDVDIGFEQHLKKHNLRYNITYHDLATDPRAAAAIRKKIEEDTNVDLIVTWGTSATLGIIGRHDDVTSERLARIPTIFTLVTNPEGAELVANRFTPRPNVTGASHIAPIYNQFRTMMAYYQAQRIGIIFSPSELNSVVTYTALGFYAQNHGVEVVSASLPSGKELTAEGADEVVARLKAEGVGWLYLSPDSSTGTKARDLIIPAAHRAGIRTFASTEQQMQAGASFGLISPYYTVGAHAAEQALRILVDGVAAHDIPIDTSPRFIHQVNPDALDSMGAAVPLDKLDNVQLVSSRCAR